MKGVDPREDLGDRQGPTWPFNRTRLPLLLLDRSRKPSQPLAGQSLLRNHGLNFPLSVVDVDEIAEGNAEAISAPFRFATNRHIRANRPNPRDGTGFNIHYMGEMGNIQAILTQGLKRLVALRSAF